MSHTATLVWGDHLLMGHGPMDELHQEFVQLIALLQTAEDSELPSLLQAMEAHLQHHFAEEDQWMLSTGFPPRDCHISEHKAVMESAVQVEDLVRSGDFATGREFAAELANWFPGHADYLDSALAQWMAKRKLGGVPVVLRRNLQFER